MANVQGTYRRTAAGDAAMRDRSVKLSAKQRAVLHFVTGELAHQEFAELCRELGAPPQTLDELTRLGVIEVAVAGTATDMSWKADPVQHLRVVHAFMADTIVDALGMRSFLFILKLERCATLEDHRALADDYYAAILKATDERRAARAKRQLMELLA